MRHLRDLDDAILGDAMAPGVILDQRRDACGSRGGPPILIQLRALRVEWRPSSNRQLCLGREVSRGWVSIELSGRKAPMSPAHPKGHRGHRSQDPSRWSTAQRSPTTARSGPMDRSAAWRPARESLSPSEVLASLFSQALRQI